MADFVIKPASDPDWGNARFLSGTLPLNAVDAAALGIAMGTDYEIGRLGTLATFAVTDVPAAMAAPSLTPAETEIEVMLPTDPPYNGMPIISRALRHRVAAGVWTEVVDPTSPYIIAGLLADTTVEVQVRAINANGPAPWSPSASATTVATGDTDPPVVNAISYATGVVTVDLTEASGAATAVWAAHDAGDNPTFATGSGWSGTRYETGTFNVTSGGDSDTISLTASTPPGAQALSLYFYDAADNLSAVERLTITVPTESEPPILNGQSGTATGQTTADFSVTTDTGSGTIYALAHITGTGVPPAADIIDNGVAVTASAGANTGILTGLAPGVTYRVSMVQVANGQQSTVVTSFEFTTAAAGPTTLYDFAQESAANFATNFRANVSDTPEKFEVTIASAGSARFAMRLDDKFTMADDQEYEITFAVHSTVAESIALSQSNVSALTANTVTGTAQTVSTNSASPTSLTVRGTKLAGNEFHVGVTQSFTAAQTIQIVAAQCSIVEV